MGVALAVLWIAWLVSWLLAANWTARTVVQQSSGSRIVQSLLIWIGAILLFGPAPRTLATRLVPASPWSDRLALVFAALGFALTWWARITLGRWWSGAVTLKADHALIRSGPYSLTRHPIYTGLLAAIAATAVERGSVSAWLGVGLSAAGLVLKLRQEERLLTTRFGPAYQAYQSEVAALIPGVW